MSSRGLSVEIESSQKPFEAFPTQYADSSEWLNLM